MLALSFQCFGGTSAGMRAAFGVILAIVLSLITWAVYTVCDMPEEAKEWLKGGVDRFTKAAQQAQELWANRWSIIRARLSLRRVEPDPGA